MWKNKEDCEGWKNVKELVVEYGQGDKVRLYREMNGQGIGRLWNEKGHSRKKQKREVFYYAMCRNFTLLPSLIRSCRSKDSLWLYGVPQLVPVQFGMASSTPTYPNSLRSLFILAFTKLLPRCICYRVTPFLRLAFQAAAFVPSFQISASFGNLAE